MSDALCHPESLRASEHKYSLTVQEQKDQMEELLTAQKKMATINVSRTFQAKCVRSSQSTFFIFDLLM